MSSQLGSKLEKLLNAELNWETLEESISRLYTLKQRSIMDEAQWSKQESNSVYTFPRGKWS